MNAETPPTPAGGPEGAAIPDRIDVGIIIERRDVDHQWIDYEWMPIAVVPGAQPRDPRDEWLKLHEEVGRVQFHAATLPLELYKDETSGYRKNLAEPQPRVYVVLSPGEEAGDPEVVPFLVTACPVAAEDYTEDSEQIVEGVPMPPDMVAWVQAFVDAHHVDVPFKKRKRKPYDPRKGDLKGGRPLVDKEPRQ